MTDTQDHPTADGMPPDERRAYLRGKLQGVRRCSATHGDRDARWYAFGLNAGLRSGRRQGFTSGVARGLMVAFGLAAVARWLAARSGTGQTEGRG